MNEDTSPVLTLQHPSPRDWWLEPTDTSEDPVFRTPSGVPFREEDVEVDFGYDEEACGWAFEGNFEEVGSGYRSSYYVYTPGGEGKGNISYPYALFSPVPEDRIDWVNAQLRIMEWSGVDTDNPASIYEFVDGMRRSGRSWMDVAREGLCENITKSWSDFYYYLSRGDPDVDGWVFENPCYTMDGWEYGSYGRGGHVVFYRTEHKGPGFDYDVDVAFGDGCPIRCKVIIGDEEFYIDDRVDDTRYIDHGDIKRVLKDLGFEPEAIAVIMGKFPKYPES
jgi:hypothetical protein